MKTFKKKRKNSQSEDFKNNDLLSKKNKKTLDFHKKKPSWKDDSNQNQRKKFKFDNTQGNAEFVSDFDGVDWHENVSKHLLAKPGAKWYEQVKIPDVDSKPAMNSSLVSSLMKEAQGVLKEDELVYKKFLEKRREKSDFSWIKTVIRSGTITDKISAHILLIQDCPVHNTNSIRSLIAMVNTKGKRECLMAMDSLRGLFLSDLLPEDKKLKSFNEHPLDKLDEITNSNAIARKKMLLFWLFENQLKDLYLSFVKNLEAVSHDTIEKTKQRAVTVISQLLKDSPEQEQFLLESIVNKIGDPIPKVGSHVCHLLGQLVCKHKMMIATVVQEVERLLFRHNVSDRAQYYCLCFYNQLLLSDEQSNIANHLITIYFGLFKMCVKKGEVNTKMMSALLTGVSRAYPYTKLKNNVMMEQLDAMFRLVHLVNFNISVQALMLIFQVLDAKDSLSDRFYSALYRKLLDPALSTSTRQSMLLNLIFRALKRDTARIRVKAFTKRLVQIALYQSPNLQCGILMLVSNLLKAHPDLIETTVVPIDSDSDSDEHFEDITDNEDDGDKPTSGQTSKTVDMPNQSSWVHRENKGKKGKTKYDPQNRNPLHCGAEYSNLWELRFLKNSFHPSVSLFAQNVFDGEEINYSGDPLQDFALIRFLDRFVYRNPKKLQQQSRTADAHRRVFGKRYATKQESQSVSVTSDLYTRQKEEKIPVEERFIYKYLKQRISCKKPHKRDDSDLESVGDDEFDALLNQIHPEGEGDDVGLDFAKELSLNKSQKKNKKASGREASESDDASLDDDDESDFEEDLNFEDDSEFQNAFGDLSDEGKDGEDEDDADDAFLDGGAFKSSKKMRKKGKISSEVFADADEFDVLLEENAAKGVDSTSTEAFMNYDNAAVKQLAWEKQRDQFVKGRDWKSKRKMNSRKFNNNNKFNKRRKTRK